MIDRVGIVGAGLIGAGWAAHFLRFAKDVVAYDPQASTRESLPARVGELWPLMERLGLQPGASPHRLRIVPDICRAADAPLVQESGPERMDMKRGIFADLDAASPPDAILASSTSGLSMSEIQQNLVYPGRTVAAHPFNPPYLIPLVEVAGGRLTDPRIVDETVAFYRSVGKQPLKIERELPGWIANRLQEALWREALHMVASGEATVQQVDTAVRFGPGLRWGVFGPFMTFHLGGGEGGISSFFDRFRETHDAPWTRLEAPHLDAVTLDRIAEACAAIASGLSIGELSRRRDDALIGLLKVLGKAGLFEQ